MIEYFTKHPTIANLLMIAFLAIGIVTAPTLNRATFPKVEPSKVEVSVAYPGAAPETVEETICQRIEDAADSIDDLAETTCEAREGVATAVLEMRQGAILDRFFNDAQTEIEAIDDFPDPVEDPVLRQLGRTDFVASVAVTAATSRPDLKQLAEDIKDRMQAFGGIPKVEIRGFSDRQIRIEIGDTELRQYGLSLQDVASAIERQNVELPAGSITATDREILLRFADERRTTDALRELLVVTSAEGGQVRLGDIATLEERFEKDEVKILFNGEPAALLDISKSDADDMLRVMERVNAFLAIERQALPSSVELTVTNDGSIIVGDRLNLLVVNGLQGLLLVCLVTWAVFGIRYAFWITMGLPVAFVGGIAAMVLLGYTLNMMTMVGLLIVIGLLMDDAIVISENIASKYEQGLPPLDAAAQGAQEVLPGVISSFMTTLCVFGSLAFLDGDLGQVLRVVPVVMIAVLALSLVEAFLILPNHLGHSLSHQTGPGPVQRACSSAIDWMRQTLIVPSVTAAAKARYTTAGIAFALLIGSVAIMAGGILKFSAFPDLDGDTLEARILLPQGSRLQQTEDVVAKVEAALARIDARLTPEQPGGQPLVQKRTVKFNENADAYETGPHVATVSVDVLSSEVRTVNNEQLFALWRAEVGILPDVIALKFTEPSLGPAGRAIDLRLVGNDLPALKAASVEMQAWLNGYDGVVDLIDDLRLGKPELEIRINEEGASLGLRAEDVAQQLRAAFFGTTVDEIQVNGQAVEIDARLAAADRDREETLDYFVVSTPNGDQVPLSAVATLEETRGYARINRVDGQRAVTIQGDVDTRAGNAAEIIADMRARFLPDFQERHPSVKLDVEGQEAEAAATQSSMLSGFMLGLVGVYLILSFQFRSYVEPVVVMLVIPFALIGAIFGHVLLGIDFTMPSMLGFAALAGVVVNNAILLVYQIKERHAPGATVADVVPSAAAARFRAILLTSITTVAGLLPLLSETSLQAQTLIPLVTSLAFGLIASILLVLYVVPAFYAILDDLGLTVLAEERRRLARGIEDPQTPPAPA